MLTVVTIRSSERGVVSRHGQPSRWLEPGRHWLWGPGVTVEVLSVDSHFLINFTHYEHLIPADAVTPLVVPAEHRAFLSVNGIPEAALTPGHYRLWQLSARVEAAVVSVHSTDDIPPAFADLLPPDMVRLVHVGSSRRALMIQNGELVRLLAPGAHHLWDIGPGNAIVFTDNVQDRATRELEALAADDSGTLLVVPEGHAAVYTVNGVLTDHLMPGHYILWQHSYTVEATIYDLRGAITAPRRVWDYLPPQMVQSIEIPAHHQVLLYIDGKLDRVLMPGQYLVSLQDRNLNHHTFDMREQQLPIVGQEIVTRDKVSLRVNVMLAYRVTSPEQALSCSKKYTEMVYAEAQMVVRRYISSVRVDDLLEGRSAAGTAMLADIAQRVGAWGVEVTSLELKDVILPGDMKAVFNQVIEAEKRAAANVIMRREETAATRSLANTARMLESSPTLMRLKELETLKELASDLGNVTVIVSPEQLQQQLRLGGGEPSAH